MNEFRDLISRIVDAVVEAEGVESITPEAPLAEAVDPDVSETLIEDTAAADLKIHFAHHGHDIVFGDGF